MAYPTDVQVAEAKLKNGGAELHQLSYSDGAVIAKRPSKVDWERLQTEVAEPARRLVALSNFTLSCVIWPDPPALDGLFADRPALLARLAEALSNLAGASEEVRVKKL